MAKNEIVAAYFDWMCSLVTKGYWYGKRKYLKLLTALHTIDYSYVLPMDANRESDGFDLRYHFGYAKHLSDTAVARYLDDRPCSVLEMMVALCQRCENTLMDNPERGDRTDEWFWDMIRALGLEGMDDTHFDPVLTAEAVERFLHQEYSYNGRGGLFYVRHPLRDMRNTEIWMQLCWYLKQKELDERRMP